MGPFGFVGVFLLSWRIWEFPFGREMVFCRSSRNLSVWLVNEEEEEEEPGKFFAKQTRSHAGVVIWFGTLLVK
jgi:hypothetical protein